KRLRGRHAGRAERERHRHRCAQLCAGRHRAGRARVQHRRHVVVCDAAVLPVARQRRERDRHVPVQGERRDGRLQHRDRHQKDAWSVSEEGTLTGQSVAATDVDVENLTYALVGTAPAELTFNADGTWSYVPPASYQSLDGGESQTVTFQYKANDGTIDSAPAT